VRLLRVCGDVGGGEVTAPARFKQIDVERALKAAQNAGVEDVRIELEPGGKIVILAGRLAKASERNPWDDDDET